jgi:NitT/TauT family transport system substrate-binding protein
MSKRAMGLVLATLLMAVAACGSSGDTTTTAAAVTTTAASPTTTSAPSTTAATGDTTTTTAAAMEPIDITVALIPILDFAPIYVALDQGIFEKHGLNVTLQEIFSSPGLVSAVTSGSADIATTSATQAVTGISNGLPIKIVSGGSISPTEGNTEILVKADSDIQTFKDLEGKTVNTVALQGLFHLGTLSAVQNDGGDWTKVETIPGQQPDLGALLDSGRVDAIVIQEPYLSQFKEEFGFRSLGNPYATLGYAIPAGVWISSIEQTQNEPETMRRFRAAMAEASDFAQANDDIIRAKVPEITSLTADQVANLALPTFAGEIPEESMTSMGNSMLAYGWLKYLPSMNQLIWQDPEG